MPRYEIVAHVTRHLDCDTPDEAAARVRQQLLTDPDSGNELLHLAVWQEEPAPAVSPLSRALRQRLNDFFIALEQTATDAEAAFRLRVEAIFASGEQGRSVNDGED
ncbi:MAG: hypothetical protein U0031_00655 [Thermomicrobiales bacterium]